MTPSPKRALLSLKSMGVMCVVLSVFVWANSRDRATEASVHHKDPPGVSTFNWSRRGSPWTYRTEESVLHALVDGSGMIVPMAEQPRPVLDVEVRILFLNLAFALAVSIAAALASERFVFSRTRRGPRPETQEEPK